MVLAWAFAVLGMFAVLFVGFQEQAFEIIIRFTEQFPGLSERVGQLVEGTGAISEPGNTELDEKALIPLILKGWGILSGFLMIVDWIRQRLQKEAPTVRSFRAKLRLALIASVAVIAILLLGSFVADPQSLGTAILPLTLIFALLFGLSAYSLGVGHFVGKLQGLLTTNVK